MSVSEKAKQEEAAAPNPMLDLLDRLLDQEEAALERGDLEECEMYGRLAMPLLTRALAAKQAGAAETKPEG